jgi:hypothetical protein
MALFWFLIFCCLVALFLALFVDMFYAGGGVSLWV